MLEFIGGIAVHCTILATLVFGISDSESELWFPLLSSAHTGTYGCGLRPTTTLQDRSVVTVRLWSSSGDKLGMYVWKLLLQGYLVHNKCA